MNIFDIIGPVMVGPVSYTHLQFKLDAIQYYQDHKDLGVRCLLYTSRCV